MASQLSFKFSIMHCNTEENIQHRVWEETEGWLTGVSSLEWFFFPKAYFVHVYLIPSWSIQCSLLEACRDCKKHFQFMRDIDEKWTGHRKQEAFAWQKAGCQLFSQPTEIVCWSRVLRTWRNGADYSLRLSTTLLFQCISMTFILEWKKESSGPRKAVWVRKNMNRKKKNMQINFSKHALNINRAALPQNFLQTDQFKHNSLHTL